MSVITSLDAWDRREFNDAMLYNHEMQKIEKSGSTRAYNYAEFMLDIFGGLYKYAPKARDPETASPDDQWMDSVYQEISKLQEWKNLRAHTQMDPVAAATATVKFCEQFIDAIPRNNDDNNDQAVPNPNDIDMSKVRRIAREACGAAAEEADSMVDAVSAMGYSPTGDGKSQYASPTAKREMAAQLINNKELRRIAELAGRMRRIAAEKQRTKTKHGVDELSDIMVGDDLARLIPSELSKLANPLMKMDFRKKYLEKQLLQYRLRGRERQGKGPVVVCIDESGSMHGDRDIWAKAVALALLQIAQQQKRNFALIHFDSHVTRTDEFSGPIDQVKLMDMIAYFTGGGTAFEEPMDKSIEIISKDKHYNNADIIMITDGDCDVGEDWVSKFNKNKEDHKVSVTTILINSEQNAGGCSQFSNTIVPINDLKDDNVALDKMFTI